MTLNTSGSVVGRIAYFPYGGTRYTSGGLNTDKRFTGQRLDQSGLYYYNARYYDATIGRFISADTLVQAPFDPQSLNRYAYCRNNPLTYNDPTGYGWQEWVANRLKGVGFGTGGTFTGGCILGVTLSLMVVQDADGNNALVYGVGFGAYLGCGVSVDPTVQVSTMQDVHDAAGWGVGFGGSYYAGVEAGLVQDDLYRAVNITTPGLSLSPIPGNPDIHCFVTYSWVTVWDTSATDSSTTQTPTTVRGTGTILPEGYDPSTQYYYQGYTNYVDFGSLYLGGFDYAYTPYL